MAGELRQTPYGAFSADFVADNLANLCDSISGIQTGPFGSQLHQEDYVPSGTPIITVEHLGENRILHRDLPMISDADRNRLSRYVLRVGDIVFSRVGSVDRRALVRPEEDGWMFSGRCLRVRADSAKIDSSYLSYFFGLPEFKHHIRAIAVGATMPSLNTSLLGGVVVPHPRDISEQRAIAHILGTLDDKIELNRRRNQTLEAMARALFKNWFVDFGPVRAKMEGRDPYLPADLWQQFPDHLDDEGNPEGWETKRVSDYLSLAYGKSLPAGKRHPEGVPVYGSGGITGFHNEALVTGPSVIVGRKGTIGSLYWEDRPCFPIDTVFFVQPEAPLPFCYYLLDSLPLRDMNTDAAVPGLNRENVCRLEVAAPPTSLIAAFTKTASRLRETIAADSRETETLAELRDTLLPKLISGELRVRDAEKFVGAST